MAQEWGELQPVLVNESNIVDLYGLYISLAEWSRRLIRTPTVDIACPLGYRLARVAAIAFDINIQTPPRSRAVTS